MAKRVHESDSWSKETKAAMWAPWNQEKYHGELDERIAILITANPVTATCGTQVHKLRCTSGGRTSFFYVCSCIGRGSAVSSSIVMGRPIQCDVEMYEQRGMGRMALTQEDLDREMEEYHARLNVKEENK